MSSGFKIAAIAIGAIVAFFVVGSIVHVIISALISVAIAALVVGGIVVAIKVARSNRQVSSKPKESEIRESRSSALPQVDLEQYSAPRPAATRPSAQDVDDELARLKREMGR
jgi:hypothetical protein